MQQLFWLLKQIKNSHYFYFAAGQSVYRSLQWAGGDANSKVHLLELLHLSPVCCCLHIFSCHQFAVAQCQCWHQHCLHCPLLPIDFNAAVAAWLLWPPEDVPFSISCCRLAVVRCSCRSTFCLCFHHLWLIVDIWSFFTVAVMVAVAVMTSWSLYLELSCCQ